MNLDLLNTTPETTPRTFIRGSTLEFVMELPKTIAAAFFVATGVTTTLESKLRLVDQAGTGGFICDFRPEWETGNVKIRFLAQTNTGTVAVPVWVIANTSAWPLGPAEFDLLITRTAVAPATPAVTRKYRSLPVKIVISDGVS